MSRNHHTDTADNPGRGWGDSSPVKRRRWAVFGLSAIDAGTPDRGLNGGDEDGELSDAIDTITNILHWLGHRGCADPTQVLDRARRHFAAERTGSDR